jgi:uncharacterized protein with PIN domain
LSAARVKSILNDPVYIGKPEHYGAVVDDSSLRIISDTLFNQIKERLEKNKIKRRTSRENDPLKIMAERYGVSLFDFIDNMIHYHKPCGGELVKNGTRIVDNIERQTFKCKKCREQFWVPNQHQMKQLKKHDKERKETIDFFKRSKQNNSKNIKKKDKEKNSKNRKMDDYFE